MVVSKFIEILNKKDNIQQLETVELKSIINEYPYFQAARALYLKGLKNQDSFKYNNELKITASYTTDRTILFNYITSNDFNYQKKDIHQQISEKITEEKLINKTESVNKTSIERGMFNITKFKSFSNQESENDNDLINEKNIFSGNFWSLLTFGSIRNRSKFKNYSM